MPTSPPPSPLHRPSSEPPHDLTPPARPLREVLHDVRGCLHALALCASALEVPMTPGDAAGFLGDIESAATRMTTLMDALDQHDIPPT